MASVEDVGEQDDWMCWLCDEPVDADRSSNRDDRGPSVDLRATSKKQKKAKSRGPMPPRLAHRACNTGKGNVDAVVPWRDDLFVIDPVPIIATADRLASKGGREIMCRCPTHDDAEQTARWIVDRLSRLEPELSVTSEIQEGAGQYMVVLQA